MKLLTKLIKFIEQQITNVIKTTITLILVQFRSSLPSGMFALMLILQFVCCCYCFMLAASEYESISLSCESPDETILRIDRCEFKNRSTTIKLNFIKPQPKVMASCKLFHFVWISFRGVCRSKLNFSDFRTASSTACLSRQPLIGVR